MQYFKVVPTGWLTSRLVLKQYFDPYEATYLAIMIEDHLRSELGTVATEVVLIQRIEEILALKVSMKVLPKIDGKLIVDLGFNRSNLLNLLTMK